MRQAVQATFDGNFLGRGIRLSGREGSADREVSNPYTIYHIVGNYYIHAGLIGLCFLIYLSARCLRVLTLARPGQGLVSPACEAVYFARFYFGRVLSDI